MGAVVADSHTVLWYLSGDTRLSRQALSDPSAGFEVAPLDLQVAIAVRRIPRDVIPDLPDRVIAATALALQLPLVSRDYRIRAAQITTIW